MVGKGRIVNTLVIGFFVFLLLFEGTTACVCAEEATLPSFGKGKTLVRLYTDYFCGPCSRMEPKIEGILSDLVKRNVITLVLIDTPIHALTPLYARYFLYILNQDRRIDKALQSRAILFEAAKDKIEETERLEEYLKRRDVRFKPTDPAPTFAALSGLMNEDGIRSTPTCVIVREGKRGVYTGEVEIGKALDLLK